MASKEKEMRDRVTGLRRVLARDLIPNPRNWRKHPKSQQDALRGVLSEIGFADALIACERLGRVCYGMEIEPRYVQVAIERWQNYTGREAVKVG